MRRAAAALAAAVAVVATTAGCTDADDPAPPPGESDVDVDTPALRALKADAGIEPCRPGDPGDAGDGPLPEVTLACLGGGPDVDMSTLSGPLVLNFWYAGCAPCKEEMPALQDFHERYGDQVPVVGVDSADVYPEAALQLARRSGVTYPLLADPGAELGPRLPRPLIGYPTFVLVGDDDRVVVAPGGIESADELVDLLADRVGVEL